MPDSEWRTCVDCQKPYELPIPYDQANPLIRDLCPECISDLQRNHERKPDEPVKEEWF